MTRRVLYSLGPDALQREGLRETPEIWEDGIRASTGPGFFEWWYFDAHFEDGSTAVITFFTKSLIDRNSPLKPAVSIAITRPDGKKQSQTLRVDPKTFTASKEHCYVRAGESWVRGDANWCYEMHARTRDLAAQLRFTGQAPAWRPGTGKNYYDEGLTQYFAWFPAIPYGTVDGFLTYDGKIRAVKGTCYHDHNWGNIGINQALSHWYWGRAHVGDTTLIFVEMNTTAEYGNQKIPVFYLAKGSQVLTGEGEPLRLTTRDFVQHSSGRRYPQILAFDWVQGAEQVHLGLTHPRLIDSFSLLTYLSPLKRLVGRLVANPYYFRFDADLDLQIDFKDLHMRQQGKGLYELMLLR